MLATLAVVSIPLAANAVEPALGGNCPVCLIETAKVVPGSDKHALTFDRQVYYFPSDKEKGMFAANPAKYAPALGGDCVVCRVNMGVRMLGKAEFAVIHDKRAYLFPSAYPDVAPAFERLREAKVRIVTLTNGSAENTGKLLVRAKLDGMVERTVAVDEVKRWKPAKEVYLHAAKAAKVEPTRMALMAAHDWDCHGASRAGLLTGFVARNGKGYHPAMDPPDLQGPTLKEIVDGLLALPAA